MLFSFVTKALSTHANGDGGRFRRVRHGTYAMVEQSASDPLGEGAWRRISRFALDDRAPPRDGVNSRTRDIQVAHSHPSAQAENATRPQASRLRPYAAMRPQRIVGEDVMGRRVTR